MPAYFDLRLPRRQAMAPAAGGTPAGGDGAVLAPTNAGWSVGDVLWVLLVYLAQVVGVIAKQVYDDIGAGKGIHLPLTAVIIAAIVSAVSFPSVYGNLQAQSGAGIRLFLAFQSGFFWRSVLTQVTPG